MAQQDNTGTLLDCDDAISRVLRACNDLPRPCTSETVTLEHALHRVLAQDLIADRDQPPFRRSTRDGFAVTAAQAGAGVTLRVIGQIRAGEFWTGPQPTSDEAVEIMTGAPVPAGPDAVAMLEHVEHTGNTIRLMQGRALAAGENVVPQGSEAQAGEVVLPTGTRLQAPHIALAASLGYAELRVSKRPRVAILATGDELVDVTATPEIHQIRNSNSHGIAALVRASGGDPLILPPAKDEEEALEAAIVEARKSADLLILSGGVSAGKYDFVETALAHRSAEFFFTGVRMQPGKPVVFGRLPASDGQKAMFFFGLPGNPVSTQVTSLLFVSPLLRALACDTNPAPHFAAAILTHEVKTKPGLTRFLPAVFTSSLHRTEVSLTGWQGSGDLTANARANCYAVIPPDVESLVAGTPVQLLLR